METAIGSKSRVEFRYVARNADGRKVRGVVEAMSARGAHTAVLEQGVAPIRIREKSSLGGLNVQVGEGRVKPVELMHFSRQLAAFVRAGIPILDAIDALAEGMDNRALQRTLYEINDALRAGESFHAALEEHRRIFPVFYRGVVEASEHTGNLDNALDRLADYLERDIENRRKVASAFAYPSVIFTVALATVVILTIFVMPRFQSFFAALGADLPLATRMLIGTMDFLLAWWWAIVGGTVVLVAAWSAFIRTEIGRRVKDRITLKLPGIGSVVHTAIVERFCRTLGSMIEAAVPLPDALNVSSEGTNNVVFKAGLREAHDKMIQGEGIARPIAETGLFPTAATQMMTAGEQTGTLERQLETAADYFEKELDYRLKRFTALFEPAVIVVAGLIVAFVAVAMVSAMYGIFGQV